MAAAFLLLTTQGALGLQRAKPQDYRDITDQLSKKKNAEAEIDRQKLALKAARGDEALSLVIKQEIARLSRIQKNAAEQAIWLTMRAFDIIPFADNLPILDSGDSVLASPEKGTRIGWLPAFEEVGKKTILVEGGRPAGFRDVKPNVAGNTASDGISRMFPGAFDSPSELASIIIHEQIHFTQNTTRGKSDVKTTAELEVEAYEYEATLLLDPNNPLGYSKEIHDRQLDRLDEILNGKDGKEGKRALARRERAAVDRSNGRRPAPVPSLASHSEDEIKRLVQEAKDQILIAQRDHDERLRNTLRRLTARSCKNPGSVTQSELNGLPRPHRRGFLFEDAIPVGPENCSDVYIYLGEGGTDANILRIKALYSSLPRTPAEGPAPLHPIKPKLFNSIFPEIKEFAIAACRNMRRRPYISDYYGDYSVMDSDERIARDLMVGQDNCSQQLFYRIIERTRANGGYFALTSDWVDGVVKANTPAPVTPPTYVAPTPAPPGGGGRCEDYGVVHCPKKSNE